MVLTNLKKLALTSLTAENDHNRIARSKQDLIPDLQVRETTTMSHLGSSDTPYDQADTGLKLQRPDEMRTQMGGLRR
jgi:hypothetical protein